MDSTCTITVDDRELKAWINNHANREYAKETVLIAIGAEGKRRIIEQASKIKASGDLEKSIDFESTSSSVQITSIGYGEEALETGSPMGTIVDDMVALRKWAGLKLGNPNLAGAVARNIKAHGSSKARGTYTWGTVKQITLVYNYLNDVYIPQQLLKLLDKYAE